MKGFIQLNICSTLHSTHFHYFQLKVIKYYIRTLVVEIQVFYKVYSSTIPFCMYCNYFSLKKEAAGLFETLILTCHTMQYHNTGGHSMSSLLHFVIPRPQKVVPWLLGLITLKSSLSAYAVFLPKLLWPMSTSSKWLFPLKVITANICVNRMANWVGGEYLEVC